MTLGKLLKIAVFVILAIVFVRRHFYYTDKKYDCSIQLLPSLTFEFSGGNAKRALRLLKYASLEDYKTICANVSRINLNVSCGGFGGGCYFDFITKNPESIDVSTSRSDLAWTAAVIVHETCHLLQYKDGRVFNEDECYKEDHRVIQKITEI
ncbi:MAG: hypothetical protein HY564_02715 [Candidatus Jacksonbacteria bacterium]|nr:hypothetical protein [Candidatus Jacksonbacteria bacterium]